MDYMFVSQRGVFERSEWVAQEGERFLKVLVVKDGKSKCVFAHGIPVKGVDSGRYVVDCVVQDCSWLGYAQVLLKSDNEPAIAKVVVESLKALRIQGRDASDEHSVPYDPQTNGDAESAVKMVKGQLRTMWLGLEDCIGHQVPATHPLMSWLVGHAADVRSFRVRGADGRSGYHRARGRPFGTRLLEFGEVCRFKLRAKETMHDGSQAHRWSIGTFLGLCKMTGQYRLFSNGTVKYARTVRRVPDQEKWCSERLQEITVTPWNLHIPRDADVIFKKKLEAEAEVEKAKEEILRKIRRAPITKADLENFGHTAGCPRCDHPVRYGYGRTTLPHSEECRSRIYKAYLDTDVGQAKIARMGQRQLEWMTEYQSRLEKVKELEKQVGKADEHQEPQGDRRDVVVGESHDVEAPPKFVPTDAERPQADDTRPPVLNRKVVTQVDKKMDYDNAMREQLRQARVLPSPVGEPRPLSPSELEHEMKNHPGMDVDVVDSWVRAGKVAEVCQPCVDNTACRDAEGGDPLVGPAGPGRGHSEEGVGAPGSPIAAGSRARGGFCALSDGPRSRAEASAGPLDLNSFEGSKGGPLNDPSGSSEHLPAAADETGTPRLNFKMLLGKGGSRNPTAARQKLTETTTLRSC